MSVVSMGMDPVSRLLIDTAFPRFSSRYLGLFVSFYIDVNDFGFAGDGNTLQREPLSQRRYLHFLIQRPSNYTKVFYWCPELTAKGTDHNPFYRKDVIWELISDHDSCWSDSIGSKFTEQYFSIMELFKNRMCDGKPMRPVDFYSSCFCWNYPKYIFVKSIELINKSAKTWTAEWCKRKIVFGLELTHRHLRTENDSDRLLIKPEVLSDYGVDE